MFLHFQSQGMLFCNGCSPAQARTQMMTIPSASQKIPFTSDNNSYRPCLALMCSRQISPMWQMLVEAINNTLFFCSVGKSLSIRETSHSPWASLSLSVCHVFKVLKSHNDHVNTVKVYQYSKFCNFTHKHSNFKCVYSKDIDAFTD